MNLFEEYRWRGLLQDATEGAEAAFASGPQRAYVGFDPTADSLHVGHLLPIMGLVHLQRAGHTPIALVGGGTGLIGDPSGKTKERQLLTRDAVHANADAIRGQLASFLQFDGVPNPARMVNNLDWLGSTGVLDFLRDVGKHFPVNVLLRKDTIRRRLQDEAAGITYTEFSYVLLQSYDFLRLFQDQGCRFQMGGQDQWGNIVGGIDLIRRVTGERAYGAVFPLITTASGVKFGKTEAGAVWLSPRRTSPFRFFQFWRNVEDADAVRYLRYFTLLPREEIDALERRLAEAPEAREAQQRLAEEVTRTVHGADGLERARTASSVLFGGELAGLAVDEIEEVFSDVPSTTVDGARLLGDGLSLVELLAETGLTPSRGEARRAVEQGGINLNNLRETDPQRRIRVEDALGGRILVLRKGKKGHHLVRLGG
jgi:tyrosyl-tRNA synthetase